MRSDTEEVRVNDAAKRLGLSSAAISQWHKRSDAPKVIRDGRTYLIWPDFPRWREEQLSSGDALDLDRARARKETALAILAEQQVEEARGRLHSPAVCRPVYQERVTRLRARLQAAPGRGAPRTVGLKTLAESQAVWEEVIGEMMDELGGHGDRGQR